MGKESNLPFRVGQLAEAKTFQLGYRGAWFRCKIKEISRRRGHDGCVLEYYDFPDEELEWIKLYQVHPDHKQKKQLMVRPCYPSSCHESQMPDLSTISEVTVVLDGVWKVGDLVDWWNNYCYWSGRVIELLGDDKAKIELTPPPLGEGQHYEASFNDLRPSLDWTPEYGWTVPASLDGKKSRRCARLIQPVSQTDGGLPIIEIHERGDERRIGCVAVGSSSNASISPHNSGSLTASDRLTCSTDNQIRHPVNISISKESKCTPKTNMDLVPPDSGTLKKNCSASDSSHIRDASVETAGRTAEDLSCIGCPLKKFKTIGGIALNSMRSDTVEAAVLDLEELANKIKWLKQILEFGHPLSNSSRPSWKFVEQLG